jgi:tetratricopeptide (TPR) repeat protein
MLDNLIIEYVKNPEDPQTNLALAKEYDRIGQTAAAISFYLRCAERTDDISMEYHCLVKIGHCFEKQGNRNYTVKSMYNAAIALDPKRPEAYYFLSRKYEEEKLHFETYATVEIPLKIKSEKMFDSELGYRGRWMLLFQKAIAGWWRGRGMESRKILQSLVNDYWDQIDDVHRKSIENNIVNLGSGPYSYAFRMYDDSMWPKLRYKFSGSKNIKKNFSQVYQDLFILSMLKGKRNGQFLEIGGADPWSGNNTALLETEFGWNGVSIEFNEKFIENYKSARPNTKVLHQNALTINYKKLLSEHFTGNVIDYLQLDIEPAKNTYECMLKIPFDEYKFAVITYEHDYYADVTRTYREKSREFLKSKGYVLVANDISPDGICNFEDWWVHPELVDPDVLQKMTDITDVAKAATDYMMSGSEEEDVFNMNINSNYAKRAFIVDNFYENPDSIREFAKQQEYVDGGLGRGFIGKRTKNQYLFPGIKEAFEKIMGKKITKWEEHGMNGRFQLNIAGEPVVYHCDDQSYAAMIYLTPDAPPETGTSTFRHRGTGIRHKEHPQITSAFNYKTFLDKTPYDTVDKFGNVYNRLVIFDAGAIHGASDYFGTDFDDGRLWHMFFFDTE